MRRKLHLRTGPLAFRAGEAGAAAEDGPGSRIGYKRVIGQGTRALVPRALFTRGLRDALAFPAWMVGFSLLGVGSVAREAGFPAGAAVLSTLLVWASPAQALLFGSLGAGTAALAVAVAICLSSIRFLPMVISILPMIRRPGQRVGTQLLAAHCVAVTVWVESLRRLPAKAPEERLPYYFGFAGGCIGLSALTTYAGYYLVGILPIPLAGALLFLTPIYFSLSLVAGARIAMDWAAIGFGFALTPVFAALGGKDFDLLAIGLFGGTAAYLLGRVRRRAM